LFVYQEAGKFAMCMIPALFAYATPRPMVRSFSCKSF